MTRRRAVERKRRNAKRGRVREWKQNRATYLAWLSGVICDDLNRMRAMYQACSKGQTPDGT